MAPYCLWSFVLFMCVELCVCALQVFDADPVAGRDDCRVRGGNHSSVAGRCARGNNYIHTRTRAHTHARAHAHAHKQRIHIRAPSPRTCSHLNNHFPSAIIQNNDTLFLPLLICAQRYYDRRGIGCYMFGIDANTIVDATLKVRFSRVRVYVCLLAYYAAPELRRAMCL